VERSAAEVAARVAPTSRLVGDWVDGISPPGSHPITRLWLRFGRGVTRPVRFLDWGSRRARPRGQGREDGVENILSILMINYKIMKG
jgi:hypothetical protein